MLTLHLLMIIGNLLLVIFFYFLPINYFILFYKFKLGCLIALSTMVSLGLPHLSILTKCDLVLDKDIIDKYLEYSEDIEDIPL